MPKRKDKRLQRLRELRRKYLRIGKRAHKRKATKVRLRALRKAQGYLAAIRRRRKRLRKPPKHKPGLRYFDAIPVASWIEPELIWARNHGWGGRVNSGVRSYWKQWTIFYIWRIRPAARPGTSNHEKYVYPGGAVDLTDDQGFIRALRSYPGGSRLRWYGPGDRVHFSSTGR